MNLKQKLNETSKKSIELKEERRKRRIDEVIVSLLSEFFQQALKNNSEYYLAFCTPWYDDLFDNEISIKALEEWAEQEGIKTTREISSEGKIVGICFNWYE